MMRGSPMMMMRMMMPARGDDDAARRARFRLPAPGSAPGARPDHEVVEGVLGHLPPEVFLVAEGAQALVHLLEVGVLGRDLLIDLVRGLEGRLHDVLAERPQLGACADEPAQRRRVL